MCMLAFLCDVCKHYVFTCMSVCIIHACMHAVEERNCFCKQDGFLQPFSCTKKALSPYACGTGSPKVCERWHLSNMRMYLFPDLLTEPSCCTCTKHVYVMLLPPSRLAGTVRWSACSAGGRLRQQWQTGAASAGDMHTCIESCMYMHNTWAQQPHTCMQKDAATSKDKCCKAEHTPS